MRKRNRIPRYIERSYSSTNTTLPRFYHLIKTHKEGPDVKIRPIVSNVNVPTTKISWLLSVLMKPLLQTVPAHLKNSLTLMQRVKNMNTATRQQHQYPYSFDVVSLYTSIPPEEAILNAKEIMERRDFKPYGFVILDLTSLLHIILRNTLLQL